MATATITRPTATLPRPARRPIVVPTLTLRRLALTVRSPRAIIVPLLTPVLFALVIAPALANTVAAPAGRKTYMTFVSLATAGLLIPLNTLFSGLGVVVDREQGAMRELLVAPIRRSSIVLANLLAATAITALQLVVLVVASAARGAHYIAGREVGWFLGSALLLAVIMYSLAEVLATRLTSPEEYIAAVPALAIVPYFFAGSLFPLTALPSWLADVAKVLPLTHALALFRYGLTSSGPQALHNIWGMHNTTGMAFLSLAVLTAYAVVVVMAAMRLFTRAGTS